MTRLLNSALLMATVFAVAGWPVKALACATCYGASDSPLAKGMNWGIVTLLGFIGCVLACVAAFFVHVGRRSARLQSEESQNQTDQQS